jgi:hypothetical protein
MENYSIVEDGLRSVCREERWNSIEAIKLFKNLESTPAIVFSLIKNFFISHIENKM